ncbi:Fanconi anemia group D2 protein isoform X2 [Cephus cinctus]|uniref:Fanconi anemia group D2 protein isoform X2 n=1 Tax=Cephus cinctus TaxID=211228 RepID=A0AAJ7RFI7_CEPCN|nr:Fanconi anemia group D2 protein isoform X2 [Cephus cinctus]
MDKRNLRLRNSLLFPSDSQRSNSPVSTRQTSRLSMRSEKSTGSSMQKSLSMKRKKPQLESPNASSDENAETSSTCSLSPKRKNTRSTLPQAKLRSLSETDPNLVDPTAISTPYNEHSTQDTIRKSQSKANANKLFNENSNLISETPVRVTRSSQARFQLSVSPESQLDNELIRFFNSSGITLSQNDNPHVLNDDAPTIRQKMETLFSTQTFKVKTILSQWQKYIENEDNLQKSLNNTKIISEQDAFGDLNKTSLVRILLQVPLLQTKMINFLLERLTEAILVADSPDDVPWCGLMLQQFRFIEEILDVDNLTSKLEELLESCPTWFQRELILFLPDIIIDSQHYAIAEVLIKSLESNPELTNSILECISNLTLGKQYMEDLRDKVLNTLKSQLHMDMLPAVTKFVLTDCTTVESYKKTLLALRVLEMQPLAGEKLTDCYTNQVLIMNVLRTNILISKKMTQAAIQILKSGNSKPMPFDIMLMLLIFPTNTVKKKDIETVLRQHIRVGLYKASLLNIFYNDFKEVARELQSIAMKLASILLTMEDRVYVDFATEWFRLMFASQADAVYKQREIIEKIILLTGNSGHVSKNAFAVLCKMSENDEDSKYLQTHCNHLSILLEKMDNLSLEEVVMLNDLLHGLCTSSNTTADNLRDDLFILLRKQLSNTKPLMKCKGVLSAVMAIKHLAGNVETTGQATEIFKQVEIAVKNCPKSTALFYDKLAEVIAASQNMDRDILNYFTSHFENLFIEIYMIDKTNYKTCYMIAYNGDLKHINMLLGCGILLPNNLDSPEPEVIDLVIHCINWFREVINAFVKDPDPLMQKQVLQRLDDLINLQGELHTLITLCGTHYQPPPCYFHYFPAPEFERLKKGTRSKGKKASMDKSSCLADWQSWQMGSSLCLKNPAYFRRLEAKVAHILDVRMNVYASQGSSRNISVAQVCFVVQELLDMFKGDVKESFIRDLVDLLPKITANLKRIVSELRETDTDQNREALQLLLQLLTSMFNWRGFHTAVYNSLLRDSLRTIASLMNESNSMLRSCRELVAEAFKYFESLSDVATRISIAVALINVCSSLMQHSETMLNQHKKKLAKMAFGFLSLQWSADNSQERISNSDLKLLLEIWISDDLQPLKTVMLVMEWLPDETKQLKKSQDNLDRLPTITRSNFQLMYKQLFHGLVKGVKSSLDSNNQDERKQIEIWLKTVKILEKMVDICNSLSIQANLPIILHYTTVVLNFFVKKGMSILEHYLKYQMNDVIQIVKSMQKATKYLHKVCADAKQNKIVTLNKLIPDYSSAQREFLHRVQCMMALNKIDEAFWTGDIVNLNLKNTEISSQCTSADDITVPTTETSVNDTNNDTSSELFWSDNEQDREDEAEDD